LAGLPAGSYALLFVLSVVHTTLAFALYTFGIRHLGAGRAAIVATIEPVVAGAMGIVLLNERPTVLKALGALLVLTGAALAQAGPRKARLSNGSATGPTEAGRRR
jgi:drug/metabolite transporter (DMT)-like permease